MKSLRLSLGPFKIVFFRTRVVLNLVTCIDGAAAVGTFDSFCPVLYLNSTSRQQTPPRPTRPD